ncbi:hypothetical protein [Lysinibacillus sphaericus]|uniref:hypothetical protein n=1 Tax=Lysinibacillus sphaericus TaxID=1421 RepID=UPI00039DBC78|nr:hypothetical protein [Lysinibacillus sphaericus]
MLVNGIEIDLFDLEKPLLLVSKEDELLFNQLIKPTLEQGLIQCQLALSTRKSISLVRDIWLAMYKDLEKLFINSGHAMLYPIRLILFELVTQEEHFKRLAAKSRENECLSLIYAVIFLQFVMQWLKERFSDNQAVYDALKFLYRTTDDNADDDQTSITREQAVAQAIAVKSIRLEVQNNNQEFASLLFQTYNFVNYLHEKVDAKEMTTLPSMRNVAETLNLFYSNRYTNNKAGFTG